MPHKSSDQSLLRNPVGQLFLFVLLLIVLPILLWVLQNKRMELRQKAAEPEQNCIAVNREILVTPVTDQTGTCHDIQMAVNAIPDNNTLGYTIKLNPGVYRISDTGTPFSLNVRNKGKVTITGVSSAGSKGATLEFAQNTGGIFFENTTGSMEWLQIRGSTGNGIVRIENTTQFQILYAHIFDSSASTIQIRSASNVSITNTEVTSSALAVDARTSENILIANSQLHDSSIGIYFANTSGDIRFNTIRNNHGHGIAVYETSRLDILGNTIVSNTYTDQNNTGAVHIENSPANSTILLEKNIITLNSGFGVEIKPSGENVTFKRNDIVTNTAGNYSGTTDKTNVNNNISEDPKFGAEYCLLPNSPAIYGNPSLNEFMGHRGPCSVTATPTPTNSVTPTPTLTSTPTPTPTIAETFSLEQYPSANITTTVHGDNEGYAVYTLLRRNGEVVTNQQEYLYTWSIDDNSYADISPFSGCTNGISAPCPLDHLQIKAKKVTTGSIPIRITLAKRTSPTIILANAVFQLSITAPQAQTLDFRLKLTGVSGAQATGAVVNIRFVRAQTTSSGSQSNTIVLPPIALGHLSGNTYSAKVVLTTPLPEGTDYWIYIKGEKHLSRKYCYKTGQTEICPRDGGAFITINASPNPIVFDFTGLPLEPGDLFPQDGKADMSDFTRMTTLFSKPCASLSSEDKKTGDVDYNGCVNIKDAFYLRKVLETRYDEN